MIPVLALLLMQAGEAYTHLPKLTLFPKLAALSRPASLAQPEALCSVHMPRMAIPKDVQFHLQIVRPEPAAGPQASVPAPECPPRKGGE